MKNEKLTIHFLSKQNIKAPLILDMYELESWFYFLVP